MEKKCNKSRNGLIKLKKIELLHWIYGCSRRLYFLPLICIFALSGCFAVTGTNLKTDDRVNSTLHRKAWIASEGLDCIGRNQGWVSTKSKNCGRFT